MIRLMIVDDEPDIRSAIRNMISWEENDIAVCGEASNGYDAISLIPLLRPDILLLDIRMPVLDGLDMAQYVAEHELNIAIIILSGHDEFQYAQRALKLGVSEYLLKPCRPEDILASVLRCADRRLHRAEPPAAAEEHKPVQIEGLVGIAMDYINRHYDKDLDLAAVAAHVYITPSYLSLLFKQQAGVNFINYLNRIRVKQACALMGNLELKIYEIAEMVGYKDVKYFTRIFKKMTGYNPSRYRRLLLAKHRDLQERDLQ